MASHGPKRVPKTTISRYSHIWDYPGVERCAMRLELIECALKGQPVGIQGPLGLSPSPPDQESTVEPR